MKPRCLWLTMAFLVALAGPIEAQDSPSRWDAVAPFVDEQTMVVARADLDRIVPQDIAEWLIGLGGPAEPVSAGTALAAKPLYALKGAGGHEVYAIVSPAYLPQKPFVVIVPLGGGSDGAAIAALLRKAFQAAQVIRGAVCAGPEANLERLAGMTPAAPPLLLRACQEMPDGAVQVAATLTADQRRVVQETLPDLPDEVGGGPSAVLTRGFLWAAASAAAPPRPSLQVVVQMQDGESAHELQRLVPRLLVELGKEKDLRRIVPNYDQILLSLLPEVAGDRLTLSLNAARIDRHIAEWINAILKREEEARGPIGSGRRAHAIFLACMTYANKHDGEWPAELKQLAAGRYLESDDLLRNPQHPELEIGFAYRKPAKAADPRTVVIYEKHDDWPPTGVVVGFRDGSVQLVEGQERFKQMLERGR